MTLCFTAPPGQCEEENTHENIEEMMAFLQGAKFCFAFDSTSGDSNSSYTISATFKYDIGVALSVGIIYNVQENGYFDFFLAQVSF